MFEERFQARTEHPRKVTGPRKEAIKYREVKEIDSMMS